MTPTRLHSGCITRGFKMYSSLMVAQIQRKKNRKLFSKLKFMILLIREKVISQKVSFLLSSDLLSKNESIHWI